MNKKQANSQPATARVSLPVFNELVKSYGLREDERSVKHYIASIALRMLEETHPSEFKYAWALDWPKGKGQTVSIHRNIPAVVWHNIKAVWPLGTPSAMLRTGLYIMYAKRFDQLVEQDKQLEDDVRRAMELLKQRREQEKTLGYDSFPPALASNNDDADTKELKLVTELEQQAVLPVGLTVVKE